MHRQTSLIPFVKLNLTDTTVNGSESSLSIDTKKTHITRLKRSRSLCDNDAPRIFDISSTVVEPTKRVNELSSLSSSEGTTKSVFEIGSPTLSDQLRPLCNQTVVVQPQVHFYSSHVHTERRDASEGQPRDQHSGENSVQELESEEEGEEHETIASILNLKRLHVEHQTFSSQSPTAAMVIAPVVREEAPCRDPFLLCEAAESNLMSSRSTVKGFGSQCVCAPSQCWPQFSSGIPLTTSEEKGTTSRRVNKSHQSTINVKVPRLTQMLLDFGQTSAVELGKTCANCGMLFTEVEEDAKLHKRLCAQIRPRGGFKKSKKRKGESCDVETNKEALPLAKTGEAVRVLDFLSEKLRTCTKNGIPACEKIAGSHKVSWGRRQDQNVARNWGRDVYILRCDHSSLTQTPEAVCLLESFGFLNTLLDSAGYAVVVVSSKAFNRVLCAVAGRLRTREQDPQLVLRPQHANPNAGDGVRCLTRRCFTFCDVDYVWLADESTVEKQARCTPLGSAAYGLLLTRQAHQVNPFMRPEDRARERENGRRLAMEEINQSLTQALAELGAQVKYGHVFSPLVDFSYSKRTLDMVSSNSQGALLPMKKRLSCCMKVQTTTDVRHDVVSDDSDISGDDLFLHSENSKSYSISEDDDDRTCNLVDMEESIQTVLSVLPS